MQLSCLLSCSSTSPMLWETGKKQYLDHGIHVHETWFCEFCCCAAFLTGAK